MKILLSLILSLLPVLASAVCDQNPIVTTTGVFQGSAGGPEYVLNVRFGVLPDYADTPASATFASLHRSTARIFEDGHELGPAHSIHTDIRNPALGRGRFSHWGSQNGSFETLRFSTSDNSDPRTNGRHYTYCVGLDAPVTTTTVPPPPTTTTTTTLPLCSEICRSPKKPATTTTTTLPPAKPE